jgi:hypothetical protein
VDSCPPLLHIRDSNLSSNQRDQCMARHLVL